MPLFDRRIVGGPSTTPERTTGENQREEGLCAEIKQNKQRCSRTVILNVNPCPRPEEPREKSLQQMSTETPLPQSSARIPEQAIEDDPWEQFELSVPQNEPEEWKYRGGEDGQASKFSDVHRTWIRWFKNRKAVH